MRATVDNPIMEIALEKNHKDITWGIKREVAAALTVGDRFETLAHRIADNLDRSYRKGILIARTEMHRVREAGHLQSANDLDEVLQKGNSGLRMTKTWRTMGDGVVRPNRRYRTTKGWKSAPARPGAPNHVKMDKVTVLEGEKFDLGGGVFTDAPGQSGVAGHDCNCRCQVLHKPMTDDQFFEKTGRHFDEKALEKSGNGNIIKAKDNKTNPKTPGKQQPANAQVSIGGVNCTVSNKPHGFGDGTENGVKKTVDAVIYTTPDGTNFIFPKKYNKQHQTMTPDIAISCWQKVPQGIRKQAQKEIVFVDYHNPQDSYWRKMYKNFGGSYATGGQKITFYRWDMQHDPDYVVKTYCHEAGHFIDTNLSTVNGRFSAESAWIKAMGDDLNVSNKKSCTAYGENSTTEDFAESVAEYVKNKTVFEKNFPNRAAILSNIISI